MVAEAIAINMAAVSSTVQIVQRLQEFISGFSD